ncbi:hypothetical protein CKM354_000920200 [Cercospora kikuchii]|uniref:F-box domain-containing protein n=1 Tax=Cercospora kikuchii TaxID=84275 RepID=A0A9P3CX62_9PEZI|nr:uncharacterized protein CKM354_000920200 [Cercospora kikuchii]GIZ46063.1 hypothetical protein CKM354_000920200 [Cercospora kikuchii]
MSSADLSAASAEGQNYFQYLATELHIQIAGYLEDMDLKNTRAVCSALARNTVDIFVARFVTRRVRRHRYVPASLETLLELSSLPVFACRLEAIEIETRRLDSILPLLPATAFSDMQQQLCSIFKNLSKYGGACKRVSVTPGPRSAHHNLALNSLCKALIESKYPLQSLSFTFWGFKCPMYYTHEPGKSLDEYPFKFPAAQRYGLRRLLSSLRSVEISVRHCEEPPKGFHQDEDKLSCHWLADALALCETMPELIISGNGEEWADQFRFQLRKLPLHTLTIKNMSNEGSFFVGSFISDMRGSLRHLRLNRVAIGGYETPWEKLLPQMGEYLTLDSIKLEELVNVHKIQKNITSKPYSYECSAESEQIRAHLLQIGDEEHDWVPREDQD